MVGCATSVVQVNGTIVDWLLEVDNPSARYLALRDLLRRPTDDSEMEEARSAILQSAAVRAILAAQYPAGYWVRPDRGYSPKYRSTIWQLLILADLGAPATDPIGRACVHVMAAALRAGRGADRGTVAATGALFSAHRHSTGLYPCLNGDLLWVLTYFGYQGHPIVGGVTEALAGLVLGDGWACVRNSSRAGDRTTWQPCIWGCVKVLKGLGAAPASQRSPTVRQAIESGTAFLLAHELSRDQRPTLAQSGSQWLRFGFPLGYGSDLLEALLTLRGLGVPPELLPASRELSAVILEKRDETGRWRLERALPNAWAGLGALGEPNKWITLRALAALDWLASSRITSVPDGPTHPRLLPGQ